MLSYREQMKQICFTVHSPDRSVTARFTKTAGFQVRLDKLMYPRHSDETLAAQLSAMVRGAARGVQRTREQLREQQWGPRDPTTAGRLKPAREDITVRVTSPRKLVWVELSGADGVEIRIKPGTVAPRGVNATALTAEINTVLSAALSEYAERRALARFSAMRA